MLFSTFLNSKWDDGLTVGCKLPLTSGKGFFNLLSLGIGYGSSKYFGALTTVGEDFFRPKFKISALVKPTSSLTLGCNAFTSEKPTDIEKANLVAKFVVTPECTAKAKVNKKGELDAAMSYQALPKVSSSAYLGGIGKTYHTVDYRTHACSFLHPAPCVPSQPRRSSLTMELHMISTKTATQHTF